jgi:hypothetical protein
MYINDHNYWLSQSASCVLWNHQLWMKHLRRIFQLALCQILSTPLSKYPPDESVLLNVTRSTKSVNIRKFILLLKPRRRWENNIKMDLKVMGWEGTDWIALVQDRDSWRALVNALMNFRVPQNAVNFLTSWRPVSFSGRNLILAVSSLVTFSLNTQIMII